MQSELGEHCIINSSFNGPTFFCFQTSFMQTVLSESVNFWLDNGDAVTHDRNGFVTDGDHSFFREGNLLATCAFSTVLNAWCPVLYTWISRLDTNHNRPHFHELFRLVHQSAKERFDPKLCFNVSMLGLYPCIEFSPHSKTMDFSAAQQAAFEEEYVDFIAGKDPTFPSMTVDLQEAHRKLLQAEAQTMHRGCEVHYGCSLLRLRSNGSLVPPEKMSRFNSITAGMRSPDVTPEEFLAMVAEFRVDFPKLAGWLDWWLRPTVAPTIFPSCTRTVATRLLETSATSNPIEGQHSLLHRATRTDLDVLEGIRYLYKHMARFEKQYLAIEGNKIVSAMFYG